MLIGVTFVYLADPYVGVGYIVNLAYNEAGFFLKIV
jgi:hypothetical protein